MVAENNTMRAAFGASQGQFSNKDHLSVEIADDRTDTLVLLAGHSPLDMNCLRQFALRGRLYATLTASAKSPVQNPFKKAIPAWLRDFKTFDPVAITMVRPEFFAQIPRQDIIHRVVRWRLACMRAGTASTKHRSEVRGSNRKLHKQKGLGKARAGSRRAPHRRGGATCFGPKPRDFSYPLPRKIQSLGLRSALTVKFNAGKLSFVSSETLSISVPKTAEVVRILKAVDTKKLLVIHKSAVPEQLLLASRVLGNKIAFLNASSKSLSAYEVMKAEFVLVTDEAKRLLEKSLK